MTTRTRKSVENHGRRSAHALRSPCLSARPGIRAPTWWISRIALLEPVRDQIVQTRAKGVSFAPGGERWFGLLARYRDERNYYFLTVRNTNTVSLRMLVNGTAVVLDTATLPVALGQWYTLRLEAIGDRVRRYVNGNLLVEATDSTHESGTYGAMVYRTDARYDDFTAMQP
jgi:hypothetical protein